MQAQIVDAESVGSDHKLEYDYPGVATALQLHLNGKFRLAVEQTRSQLMQVWSPVDSGKNALEGTGRSHGARTRARPFIVERVDRPHSRHVC